MKHFGVSAFMAMFSYQLSRHHFEMSENDAVMLSAGFTFTIGGAKEINDSRHPLETSSFKDLAADILGIAVGIFIITRQ
ncbi:MAG: hypothetical protein GF307_04410 [candidate division Zixibacteria bacterium]|nr:hypothetical protein [candidate division Zixibacteria bacterium]